MKEHDLDGVFLGSTPHQSDTVDVFGAHVGLTLDDLHQLRGLRAMLEEASGASVTLLGALRVAILSSSYALRLELEAARQLRQQCKDG